MYRKSVQIKKKELDENPKTNKDKDNLKLGN